MIPTCIVTTNGTEATRSYKRKEKKMPHASCTCCSCPPSELRWALVPRHYWAHNKVYHFILPSMYCGAHDNDDRITSHPPSNYGSCYIVEDDPPTTMSETQYINKLLRRTSPSFESEVWVWVSGTIKCLISGWYGSVPFAVRIPPPPPRDALMPKCSLITHSLITCWLAVSIHTIAIVSRKDDDDDATEWVH